MALKSSRVPLTERVAATLKRHAEERGPFQPAGKGLPRGTRPTRRRRCRSGRGCRGAGRWRARGTRRRPGRSRSRRAPPPRTTPRPVPFVTNALALRIYNHLQERVNDGTCELPAQVALALVIFCMPMSVREAHKARRLGRRPRPLEARRRRRPRRARRRLRARLCCCLGCVGSTRARTQAHG